ncbi:MAG: metal-dependent hydrolase [Christensenellaceae bacterium]|jgi:L-ascorbate metabolism protein UlaG (beta-lactamase superfamily)|nr:metal-dependent hydrolase [Christensenellaceae bacterium]
MLSITKIQHACFLISAGNATIVTDPYCTDIENAIKQFPTIKNPDYILVSHGHHDHIGNLFDILGNKTTVIANFEICNFLARKGITKLIPMNTGGRLEFTGGSFTMVHAIHSSTIEDNGESLYAGLACGYIISIGGKTIYFAGDTDLFGDMQIMEELYKPQIGLLPIGGRFTMNIASAAFACNNYFNFEIIIPMHYNTFPPIAVNTDDFVGAIKKSKVVVLNDFTSALVP